MSGRVEFSYSHTEELPAGGRLAAELHKALRARDEQALTRTLTPARTQAYYTGVTASGVELPNIHTIMKRHTSWD